MLAPYPATEAVLSAVQASGAAVKTYGRSVQGRPLLVADLGGEGPVVMVTAGLHGPEHIGVCTALEILRLGPLPGARLVVCPLTNPDGHAATFAREGRGPLGALRKNARGVDLNRNFPLPYGARPSRLPFAGSLDPAAATYRGEAPLSEPESRALAELMRALQPHASVNLHSFMGTLIAARVWTGAEWAGYRRLCRAFRAGGGRYHRLGTPIFDVFTGELEDWQHHALRCWAICVECFSVRESLAQHWRAPSVFWRFNPRDPGPIARRDAAAVRALLTEAAALPRPHTPAEAARALPMW